MRSILFKFFIKILFILILPLEIFSLCPRLLITLGSDCDFTIKDLIKEKECLVVSGTFDEIISKVNILDLNNSNHLIVIDEEVEDFCKLPRKLGYDFICLNDTFESAIKTLEEKIQNIPLTNENFPKMDPFAAGSIYKLMMEVDKILKKHKINYWATCGTLLGAVRHKGLIPWDDDLDIAIFEEDVWRLEKIQKDLKLVGLEIFNYEYAGFYKIFYKNGKSIAKDDGTFYPWTYPFLDVFPQKITFDKIIHSSKLFSKSFPQEHFFVNEIIFPLPELKFGPMNIPVPHNSCELMNRFYGFDWNEVTYVQYDHENECDIKKVKVKLVDRSSLDYVLPNGNN